MNLDYVRWEHHPELTGTGSRLIEDETEWLKPTWSYDGFDAIDYGFELQTSHDRLFSVTWDPPGEHEGIGLREVALLGTAVSVDADVAIWDVGGRSGWSPLIGQRVTKVVPHYRLWSEYGAGSWCPHITISTGTTDVEVIMGDSQDGELVPSADNVAILFARARLPHWRVLTS